MKITIDYDQGKFIAEHAATRINSAMAVLTESYHRQYLSHMPDTHYNQVMQERRDEIAMLKALVAEVCTYCEYTLDGKDTDGTKWYRCTVHDELAPSEDAPCAGYVEEPYIYAKHPMEG